MRVAVLMGGLSREREISLKTGRAVLRALELLGYEGIEIDVGRGLARALGDVGPDVAFIALHGKYGEDGTVQGLLEILGIPYTGSGVLASAAAIDKIFTKQIFRAEGLPTPPFSVLRIPGRAGGSETVEIELKPPYVVKPSREGSSLGMSFVEREEQLEAAVKLALKHDNRILVERYVEGKEITVGVIGREEIEALPPIEIVPRSGRYDFESKYTVGATEYLIPPRLPSTVIEDCRALALSAHRTLGCSGMSRVDMIVGEEGIELLEVNTIPGMTETSLLPKSARAAGIEFPELIDRLIRWGLEEER